MLGRLLEFSVATRPLPETLAAFGALGFADVPVGDIAGGAYAVVGIGGLALGLHDAELDGITPTFVRPDLKDHVRALRRCGVDFDFLELADDQFHRAGFRDPSGCMVHLIEARTFAPVDRGRNAVPICGEFVELSVAVPSLEEPMSFWTRLGLESAAAADAPHASARLEGNGLSLGLHETARFRSALTFRADNLPGRIEFLRAKGCDARWGSPLTAVDAQSVTVRGPGGISIFIVDAQAASATESAAAGSRAAT